MHATETSGHQKKKRRVHHRITNQLSEELKECGKQAKIRKTHPNRTLTPRAKTRPSTMVD